MCLLSQILIVISITSKSPYDAQDLERVFIKFATQQNRTYLTNETEFRNRLSIFKKNVEDSEFMNKLHNPFSPVYGLTKFSDLSKQEFQEIYLSGYKSKAENPSRVFKFLSEQLLIPVKDLPQKVDWREKKVLTDVKDQETCGACWAFSTVETIESMVAIQTNSSGNPPRLSVQELIDCDQSSRGCQGGDLCQATLWAQQHGVVSEASYPLTDKTDPCHSVPPSVPRVMPTSHSCSSYLNNEAAILSLLTRGPVAAAIDATTWHNYIGGVIQWHCDNRINHAVQIVGYDLTDDVPHYIVRNSWGKDFGDEGFLYIKFGANVCGITSEVASLQVENVKK